jgi:hypothetical protein
MHSITNLAHFLLFIYLKNRKIYEKYISDIQCVSLFSVTSVKNIFHSDIYLVTYVRDVYRNTCWSSCSMHYFYHILNKV